MVGMTTQNGHQIRTLARVGAAALVTASLVAACGSSSKTTSPPATSGSTAGSGATTGSTSGSATITIKDFKYNNLTVKAGTKVEVVNSDGAPHTVTASGTDPFDTGTIQGGSSGSFTAPTTPGSYDYICGIHNYMHGTLVVTS